MKKVLMVSCDGLGNGGIQHVMMNIVRNLSKEYHFDMLLFTDEERYFDEEFKKYGTIFRIPKYEGKSKFRYRLDYYIRFYRLYKGVKKILQENGPYEIIHCNNYFEAAPCLMAAKHCKVPVRISHSHSAFLREKLFAEIYNAFLRKLLNRYATHKIGCSQKAADYLFGANKGGISVPNAIDLKRFDFSKYPRQKDKHSFIHVGSFGVTKNQLFILDIFGEIQKQWQDATLKLVGNKDAEYEKLLHKKIKDLKLKNIEFLPHNSDIPALFAKSEYMIFPSLYEGFGLVLAEAQAMNVKCLASEVVPLEANIGLCKYLSLKQPAKIWAKTIFDCDGKPTSKPDTEKVNVVRYIEQIKDIYKINKDGVLY